MKTSRIFLLSSLWMLLIPALLTGQTPAQNKAVCQSFYEAFNNKDLKKISSFISEDFLDHAVPPGIAEQTGLHGLPLFLETLQIFFKAFPDIKVTPIKYAAEGDIVMVYFSMTGTHLGEFAGIHPTGKRIELLDVDIVRFDKKGKAAEHWAIQDGQGMMAMLGVDIPTPAFGTIQDLYGKFGKGDILGVMALLSEDIHWTDAGTGVADLYIGQRMGKEQVMDFFQKLGNHLDIRQFETSDYFTVGNKVAATGHLAGVAKATGEPFASDFAMTFEVDGNGKVSKHHLYLDTDNIAKSVQSAHIKTANDFLAAMDASDLLAYQRCVSPDYKIYHPNFPNPLTATEHFEMQVKPFNKAFEKFTHQAVESSVDGNSVTMRGIVTGKHTGELMGIPASNNTISVPWMAMATMDESGKIKELHIQFNQLSFLAQIGANPMAKN